MHWVPAFHGTFSKGCHSLCVSGVPAPPDHSDCCRHNDQANIDPHSARPHRRWESVAAGVESEGTLINQGVTG